MASLRPSVLVLYTDQQRWDALGASGNPDIHTPNLDKLAAEGVNFDHCFVQSPVCMPSRVSMLTGRYPSSLNITHMGVPVPKEVQTAAHYFAGAGYRTANLGKLHFLPHANRDHREPHPSYGFDHLEISDEPGAYEDAYRAWVRARDPSQLPHLSVGLPPAREVWLETMTLKDAVPHPTNGARRDFDGPVPFPGADSFTHSAFVADRTCAFIERAREPFFCVAAFYSPHAPWVVPQRFLDLYDPTTFTLPEVPANFADDRPSEDELRRARHGYYAMVSEVDHYVGEILEVLERQGLSENTLVIFTSDHGEWLGLRGRYGKGYPGDDAVTRVPLLLRWSRGFETKEQVISDIVEVVDILPTLLEACALQIPPAVQGRSLLPLIRGKTNGRTSALTEGRDWKTLRTRRYRYLVHADDTEKLWDLEGDPQAYRDVAALPDYKDTLTEHRLALLTRLLAQEQPLARTWPY